jgi:hypothetical protein
MINPIVIDVIRGAHLVFLALGLGPALYFDLRSMLRITRPMWPTDFSELHNIHRIVSLACVGLWITGVALIGIRTGFDLDRFSPKLIGKIIIVTVLTLNALLLARYVIPTLTRHQGYRLIDLPVRLLLPMTLSAGASLSCWLLALALGSSVVLKTADWPLLIPVLLGGAFACLSGVTAIMFTLRAIVQRGTPVVELAPAKTS